VSTDAPDSQSAATPQTPPQADPAKPAEAKSGSGTVTLRTAYPVDRFEHGVKGVEHITAEGVEVAKGKVKQLIDAAERVGVRLEEIA
jgi:hypothetical protein